MNDTPTVEEVAQSVIADNVHYISALSSVATRHTLTATEDIVSSSGIKLVASGTQIDEHLREKLVGHHLPTATLEKNLSIAGGVTPEGLAVDIGQLIDEEHWFQLLSRKSGDPGAMRHGLVRLDLPAEILFRLSVARIQRPILYRHSLKVSLISHFLALRLGLKQAQIDKVLIAALCHDLGELYTPPEVLEPGHQITDEERKFIYVHPITGWLIVHDMPEVDPEVAKAIIQHQERLDGSGYPKGIKGDAIGIAGRILAVADISAAIMAKFSDHRRLNTLLRLNAKKYDHKIVGLLHEVITPEALAPVVTEDTALQGKIEGFAALLEGLAQLRATKAITHAAPLAFLTERLYNLRSVVLESGFDPDNWEILVQLANEDASIAQELMAVIDELQYQMTDMGHEMDRRIPEWQKILPSQTAAMLADWRQQLQTFMT